MHAQAGYWLREEDATDSKQIWRYYGLLMNVHFHLKGMCHYVRKFFRCQHCSGCFWHQAEQQIINLEKHLVATGLTLCKALLIACRGLGISPKPTMVRAVAQAVWIIWIAPECLFSNQTQNIESDKVFHIYTHHGYCPCWSAIVQCTSSMPCFDPLTQGCSFSLTSFPQTNHTPSRGLWRVWLRIVRWYYTEE